MTPSRPAPSNSRSQPAATARSRVAGVRWSGGRGACQQLLQRRPPLGLAGRSSDRPPAASRSKATNEAGVSSASLATREAAGCRRCCRASKSSPPAPTTTISPSTMQPGATARRGRAAARGSSGRTRAGRGSGSRSRAGPAKHQGAKAVPLRLEQEIALGRQRLGDLGEHRFDRRGGQGIRAGAATSAARQQSARRRLLDVTTPTYDRRLDIWSACERRDEG